MNKNNIINAILLSLSPKQCETIANEKQSIIIKKTSPKIKTPFKCYIYCMKSMKHLYKFPKTIDCTNIERYYITDHNKYSLVPQGYINGKVIGEFMCDNIIKYPYGYCDGTDIDDDSLLETQLEREDINIYAKGKTIYGWHISNLVIYGKPKELNEFYVEDTVSIKQCEYRVRAAQPEDVARNGGLIKGSYACITKPLTCPPKSWQYIRR